MKGNTMPNSTHPTRRNLGRNSIARSKTRVSTTLLRYLRKTEKQDRNIRSSFKTVSVVALLMAWSFTALFAAMHVANLGAQYGKHIAKTRAHKHYVSLDHAMWTTAGFSLLWLAIAFTIAIAITCLAVFCFVPKRMFRINLFRYHTDEDGRELAGEMIISAVRMTIYAIILTACSFEIMGLLTDMVTPFGK